MARRDLAADARRAAGTPGSSGRNVREAGARRAAGSASTSRLPDEAIANVIKDGKVAVHREVQNMQRGPPESTPTFGDDSPTDRAHQYYVYLQVYGLVHGYDFPDSISALRRRPLPNSQTRFWRDGLIRTLNEH